MTGLRIAAAALLLAGAAQGAARAQETAPVHDADLDYAHVEFVRAELGADGRWCFAVTVRHRDEGWGHYADLWEVLDPAGERVAERVLAHPHDDEQPFTRRQCGVAVPEGVRRLRVRARCTRHGFGGREVVVDLDRPGGDRFSVSGPDGGGGP